MKRVSVQLSALIGAALVAPLLAIFFLAYSVAGTSFPAYTVFDFVSRVLPGSVVTFGIDLLVDIVRGLNLGPTASTAKNMERVLAVLITAIGGIILSVIFFASRERAADDAQDFGAAGRVSGAGGQLRREVFAGVAFGLAAFAPVLLTMFAYDRESTLPPLVNVMWLVGAFAVWGVLHGLVAARLLWGEPGESARASAGRAAPASASAAYIPPMMRGVAQEAAGSASATTLSRREFLVRLGGASAVITVAGAGLSAWLNASRAAAELAAATTGEAGAGDAAPRIFVRPDADGLIAPAPGTRPEYTPLGQHYRIDISAGSGPVIREDTYRLEINGLVEAPISLTLDDIRAYPSRSDIITMSCISNPIAGDLIGTTKWTGVSMQKILEVAKPLSDATHIKISAADGFFEIVSLAVIRDDERVMLAYAWDDQPLTGEHGFPLRIHIPNRYGMKQPKWITQIDFLPDWEPGYWVERGWDREALVRTTAVIDTVAVNDAYEVDGQKVVPVGGMAWSGTRGISKVEVSVDGGAWQAAQLRTPLSDRAWTLWRYEWPFQEGWHSFAVRCYEADGTPQIEIEAGERPSGATGIHQREAKA
jgi:DMSO/TMAO reductase YedYZ molybdopterin-dependent catalytic subunit